MALYSIDALTLKHWLDNNEAVLVDVREPEEYAQANIPGATLVPLDTVTLSRLPAHDEKKLVLHCKAGYRSANACMKLLAEDPSLDVYNLEGGIMAWQTLPANV